MGMKETLPGSALPTIIVQLLLLAWNGEARTWAFDEEISARTIKAAENHLNSNSFRATLYRPPELYRFARQHSISFQQNAKSTLARRRIDDTILSPIMSSSIRIPARPLQFLAYLSVRAGR
jgi:hypothetical protein